VGVYDLPKSVSVLAGHRLTLEGDLESLVWKSEAPDSDLGETGFQQVLVYCCLKLHQLLRSRQARDNRESSALVFVFKPLNGAAEVSCPDRRGTFGS
jgi:hypothetical protein